MARPSRRVRKRAREAVVRYLSGAMVGRCLTGWLRRFCPCAGCAALRKQGKER